MKWSSDGCQENRDIGTARRQPLSHFLRASTNDLRTVRLWEQKATESRYTKEDSRNPESPAPRMMFNDRSAGHGACFHSPDTEKHEEDGEAGSYFLEAEIPDVVEDADTYGETGAAEETGETPGYSKRGEVLGTGADDSEDQSERQGSMEDDSPTIDLARCSSNDRADTEAVGVERGRSNG
jgi:hypothetical protein